MPTGAFASHYWPGDGVEGEVPVEDPTQYHYPYWFDHSSMGVLWTPLGRHGKKRLRGFVEKVKRKLPPRLLAAFFLFKLILSPSFSKAVQVVDEIRVDPNSRKLKLWGNVDRLAVSNPEEGENTYRHLLGSIRLKKLGVRRDDAALLIDLAWKGVKAKHG